jgi:hypothetical protein
MLIGIMYKVQVKFKSSRYISTDFYDVFISIKTSIHIISNSFFSVRIYPMFISIRSI